jgi:hypothetical protein
MLIYVVGSPFVKHTKKTAGPDKNKKKDVKKTLARAHWGW